MNDIISILKKYKRLRNLLLLTSAFAFLTAFFKTEMNLKISDLIDSSLMKSNLHELGVIIFAIIFLLILFLISNAIGKIGAGYMVNKGEKQIYEDNIKDILSAEIDSLELMGTGEILTRFNDDTKELIDSLNDLLKNSLSTILQMIVVLVMLSSVNFTLAAISFILPIAYNLWFLYYSKRVEEKNSLEREQMTSLSVHMADCLHGWSEIVVNQLERKMEENHNNKLKEHDKTKKWLAKFWSTVGCGDSLMSYLYPLIIVIIGTIFVVNQKMTWGQIVAFINLSPAFLNFIWDLDPQAFRRTITASQRVQWFWNLQKERNNGSYFDIETDPIIECRQLNYTYNQSYPVLKNITFSVKKGQKIAIAGESGSGKTTLLKLICGIIPSQKEGDILIGNHRVDEWNLEALHRNFAYMRQNTYIYATSLLDNITLGKCYEENKETQIQRVIEIINKVGLSELIDSSDKSLSKTPVGLSDGERQRIAFARCLYKDAPVWILDEPTSALDKETEKQIINLINEMTHTQKTIIAVTHRLQLAKSMEHIFILDYGNFTEDVNHEFLLNFKKRYWRDET